MTSASGYHNQHEPLVIHRNRFVRNGRPHIFRGVVYQLPISRLRDPRPPDPRSLPAHLRYAERDVLNDQRFNDLCRDVALFEELGINALWIYQVTPGVAHEKCMALLAEKDIDVFVGLSSPSESINRYNPQQSYTPELLQRYYSVVDAFQSFDNVAGFVAGNVIVNDVTSTAAATIVKAVIRDVKAYIKVQAESNGKRVIPVGVSDSEWTIFNTPIAEFYTRGEAADHVDFYACINYGAWPMSTPGEAKWVGLLEKMKDTRVPVVVSEYGANIDRPRGFQETKHLYSKEGLAAFSGGFAYEFHEAANRYGLVRMTEPGGIAEKLEDFECLKARLKELNTTDSPLHNLHRDEHYQIRETNHTPPEMTHSWLASAELPASPLTPEQYLQSVDASG